MNEKGIVTILSKPLTLIHSDNAHHQLHLSPSDYAYFPLEHYSAVLPSFSQVCVSLLANGNCEC